MGNRSLPGTKGGSHYDKLYPKTGTSKLDRMTSEGYQSTAREEAATLVMHMEPEARSTIVEAALDRIKQDK
jgi:hypothetical protein